jgi:hypothetical protein
MAQKKEVRSKRDLLVLIKTLTQLQQKKTNLAQRQAIFINGCLNLINDANVTAEVYKANLTHLSDEELARIGNPMG